jgi:hypothetical protein
MVSPSYFAQKLSRPLPITDGPVLYTIGDASRYLLALPEIRRYTDDWVRVAVAIVDQKPVPTITHLVETALLREGKIDPGAPYG